LACVLGLGCGGGQAVQPENDAGAQDAATLDDASASDASAADGEAPPGNAIPASVMALDCNACARTSAWPTVPFGTIRLWDSGINWALLETAKGTYDFTMLDTTLDFIQKNKLQAIYVLGHVPCWATTGTCNTANWSSAPPTNNQDYFDFVTTLVGHCSPGGACVKDQIKIWEMWNEPNNVAGQFWSGSMDQLLALVAGAYPIIKANVPGALITTPAPTDGGGTRASWMTSWLVAGGTKYADIVAYHGYLGTKTPEAQISLITKTMQDVANANGMGSKPQWNTEGGWGGTVAAGADPVSCPTALGPTGCSGALARWYILQLAAGVGEFTWYSWDAIGTAASAYGVLDAWLVGASFTAPCAADSNGNWTCTLVGPAPANAAELVAWNPTASSNYVVPATYTHYRDLAGNSTLIAGGAVTLGVEPILLTSI
jgi:hypothetical protein